MDNKPTDSQKKEETPVKENTDVINFSTQPQSVVAFTPEGNKLPILPMRLQIALMIFSLAGGAAVLILPAIAHVFGGDQPNLIQVSITGIVLIALTSILLNYSAKVIGLGSAWVSLALIYNALIIIIKFILSPSSLYSQTIVQSEALSITHFDPNNISSYGFIAAGVAGLYIGVFAAIYSVYRRKVNRALDSDNKASENKTNPKNVLIIVIVSVLGLIASIISGTYVWLIIAPLIFLSGPLSYLNNVFSSLAGFLIMLAIGVGIITVGAAFKQAKNTSIEMRDGTIIASFFLLGLYLIIIYHILWIIYMIVMMSLWPFKTIAPSGK